MKTTYRMYTIYIMYIRYIPYTTDKRLLKSNRKAGALFWL